MTIVTNPCATDRHDEWPNSYGDHEGDVTLVVGGRAGGGAAAARRFRGHRRVLATAGGPLAALALTGDRVLYVTDVDEDAFDQVMRFLHGSPLELTSAEVARNTLDTAHKYKLPALLDAAAEALISMLGPDSILLVVRDLRLYCGSEALIATVAPSAPPLSALAAADGERAGGARSAPASALAAELAEARMALACARLLRLALDKADEHADKVLTDTRFTELSYGDASLIALRPGLRLSSEAVLAVALRDWAGATVRRVGRNDIPRQRRAALGELCYAPRYLLLTEKEFLQDVAPLEILDRTETALVLAALEGQPLEESTDEQRGLLERFAQPRPSAELNKDTNNNHKKNKKKSKKKNGASGEKGEKGEDGAGCCQCFGEGLLRTLLCLFD